MKPKPKITIGDTLKQIRTSKGISLTEISRITGIQLATLSRIENNKMTGKVETHVAIVEALGVSLADLYVGIVINRNGLNQST